MKHIKYIFIFFMTISVTGQIKNTAHNLSVGGQGHLKTSDTTQVCIFCHSSHSTKSSAPLWNREEGIAIYSIYDSSTLYSSPGQPDGSSKLCLSCHDGTIALGKLVSLSRSGREFSINNSSQGKIPSSKRSNLGTDLSNDHPISFNPTLAVNNSPELQHPPLNDTVKYEAGKIQCTTCHNPHDNMYDNLLVKSNVNSAICKTCHTISGYNNQTVHDISTVSSPGTGNTYWPHTTFTSVTENSCLNCHYNHGAPGKERLLSHERDEEVCYTCHKNSGIASNIKTEMQKIFNHPVHIYDKDHHPTEDIETAPIHVECTDCHNPHKISSNPSSIGIYGSLKGVSGMNISGSIIDEALYEYEICLKCHGQEKYEIFTQKDDQQKNLNMRQDINPTNESYHPIAAVGKSSRVPSLTLGYTTSSKIFCSDCHNNNDSNGPRGPHGSTHEFLLEKQYETADYTNFSTNNYALCFKCHDPNILMSENQSGFSEHDTHVREENTPCSACHDPHGSPDYPALINFDLNIVQPSVSGVIEFETNLLTGSCTLNCHGKEHNKLEYDRR